MPEPEHTGVIGLRLSYFLAKLKGEGDRVHLGPQPGFTFEKEIRQVV